MRNQHSIEPRSIWPAEWVQCIENVFQDVEEFFRQAGLSPEQIDAFFQLNAFFRLIKEKVHYYRVRQEKEMTYH